MQQNIALFILIQKQKQLSMKATLMMYSNQSMVGLYQIFKSLLETIQAELLIQLSIIKFY